MGIPIPMDSVRICLCPVGGDGANPSGIEEDGDVNDHSLFQVAWMKSCKRDEHQIEEYDESIAKEILKIYQYLESKFPDADRLVSRRGNTMDVRYGFTEFIINGIFYGKKSKLDSSK